MLIMYTKKNCPFCDAAKQWLTERNIDFGIVDVTDRDDLRNALKAQGHTTVPQFYVGTRLIVQGGYEGLSKLTVEDLNGRINGIS
jgi:glutaredoxin